MFFTGQKVVCVKGKYSACGVKLIEQQIYTIKSIRNCNCSTILDVGLRISTSDTCFKCNTLLSSDGTWWLYAKRFVPLEDWQKADEIFKQLLKEVRKPVLSK